MAPVVRQHIHGAAGAFSTTYNGGATPFTITNAPNAGDVLILRLTQSRSGSRFVSVAGCGATWTRVAFCNNADESVQYWRGVGATGVGTVTATATINTWARGSLTHIGGLTATTVVSDGGLVTNNASGADPGPIMSAGSGQMVFATAYQGSMSQYPSVGTPPDPATGWVFDPIAVDLNSVESGAGYRIPTSTVNHQVTAQNGGAGSGFHLMIVVGDAALPPDAPTGLAVDPDITTADFDWTASTGSPTGYEIRLNGGSATDIGNVLAHTFTGLTANTAYNSPGAEVRAYNASGFSSWVSISFTTDPLPDPPDAPTNLTQSTTATTATLGWDASTGAPDGYEVRINGGGATDVGAALDHIFGGRTPETTYTLEVRAYNLGGYSSWVSIEATTLALVATTIFTARYQTALPAEQVKCGGVWLSELANCADLTWSHRWPGGCWEASWRMDLDPKFTHPALRRGQQVEIRVGPGDVWTGTLDEPDRDGDGWALAASGPYREAERALCLNSSGDTTSTPDTAIDEAIARGALSWTRPDSLSATAYVTGDTTEQPAYISALLEAWSDEAGMRVAVGADRVVYAAADPTVPMWHMTPDSGVLGISDEEYATHLFGTYLTAGPVYNIATAEDAAAAALWGRREFTVDLTPLGIITLGRAEGILEGMLAKGKARLGWTNALQPSMDEITTEGGVSADLRFIRAGQMVRLHGVADETRTVTLATDVVIGESRYSSTDGTITLSPVDKAPRNLADILAAPARIKRGI